MPEGRRRRLDHHRDQLREERRVANAQHAAARLTPISTAKSMTAEIANHRTAPVPLDCIISFRPI